MHRENEKIPFPLDFNKSFFDLLKYRYMGKSFAEWNRDQIGDYIFEHFGPDSFRNIRRRS